MNLFKLTEKQLTDWETTRKKNRYLYYLKWAFWIAIFFSLIMFLYNKFILSLEFEFLRFVTLAGVSFIGGLILGIINRSAMEYGYKLSKEKNN